MLPLVRFRWYYAGGSAWGRSIKSVARRLLSRYTCTRLRDARKFLQESGMAKKAPNPIDKHVGSRVRMRRMMLSMSQEKLGDALGLTFQQVQKYEKGTNRIGASRLQQISLILQVAVSFFFEGAPPPPGRH